MRLIGAVRVTASGAARPRPAIRRGESGSA